MVSGYVGFLCWFTAANADLIHSDAPNDSVFELVAKIRTTSPNLYGKQSLWWFYEILRVNAPYLFPKNPL